MYGSAQQLVVQPHGTHHQTLPPHIYTHTPSNPNPDPATKLLLFHSTRGKSQCTQPFHSKIRISITNSVGAEGEGRQLNMLSCPIWKVLQVYTHTHKTAFSLSLSRTYVWYITAKQFTAISANRGYRGWSLTGVNYQHSGDFNLILSLMLLLPNDHHQIWQMGLGNGPVFILNSHMANMQEQAELNLKAWTIVHVACTHFWIIYLCH